MKFLLVVLACLACALAAPAEKDLKGSEQTFLASPYAAYPYAAYSAYPYAAAAVPSYVPTAYSAYSAYPYSAYYYR